VSRIYDISVPIRSGGLVYPGNPEIEITLQQAVAKGAGANVSFDSLRLPYGTHADAARHFFDDGQTVDRFRSRDSSGRRSSSASPTTSVRSAPRISAIMTSKDGNGS